MLTIKERLGRVEKQPIVVTWAYHPRAVPMAVTNSILLEAAKFGMEVRFARPEGWELDPDLIRKTEQIAKQAGGSFREYR